MYQFNLANLPHSFTYSLIQAISLALRLVHHRSEALLMQATVNEGIANGLYVAARAGFKSMTLR